MLIFGGVWVCDFHGKSCFQTNWKRWRVACMMVCVHKNSKINDTYGKLRAQGNLTWPSMKELEISFTDLLICVCHTRGSWWWHLNMQTFPTNCAKSCDHVDGTWMKTTCSLKNLGYHHKVPDITPIFDGFFAAILPKYQDICQVP